MISSVKKILPFHGDFGRSIRVRFVHSKQWLKSKNKNKLLYQFTQTLNILYVSIKLFSLENEENNYTQIYIFKIIKATEIINKMYKIVIRSITNCNTTQPLCYLT